MDKLESYYHTQHIFIFNLDNIYKLLKYNCIQLQEVYYT